MRKATLYTRADCHLCHRADDVLATIAAEGRITYERRHVDDDPALAARYGARVPVVEIDGVPVAEGRVSEYRLRRYLGVPPTPRGLFGLARAALRRDED